MYTVFGTATRGDLSIQTNDVITIGRRPDAANTATAGGQVGEDKSGAVRQAGPRIAKVEFIAVRGVSGAMRIFQYLILTNT